MCPKENMKTEVEKKYKKDAREIIDLMYDKGFIDKDCSRESMRVLEEYLAYVLQSNVDSAIRSHDLIKKLRT